MKAHIKNYLKAHGLDQDSYITCQVCNAQASDIHHVVYKSQQGKDNAENLIALCREDHDRAHFKKEPYLQVEELQEIVNLHLKSGQ